MAGGFADFDADGSEGEDVAGGDWVGVFEEFAVADEDLGVWEGVEAAVTLPDSDALGVDCGVTLLVPVPLALAPCDSVDEGVPDGVAERLAVVEREELLDAVALGVGCSVPVPLEV